MKPHGGYKYAWPEDYDGLSRSGARRAAQDEIAEQLDSEIHPAEMEWIACALGECRLCGPRGRLAA